MALFVVDKIGKLGTNGIDVMEPRERHIAIEVGGSGSWVYGEYLQRSALLLELHRQYAHHGILCRLAGYVCQWMPIRANL